MAWPKGKSRKQSQPAAVVTGAPAVAVTATVATSAEPPTIASQSLKEANDMLERQTLQEIVRVPAVPVSEAATGVVAELLPTAKHWQVSIKHNPALIVEAPTRAAAIEEYKRQRNIAWTTHVVECVELVEVSR